LEEKRMPMKKTVFALVLLLVVAFTVPGQNSPIDLILLLDTSSSMSAFHQGVNEYLTGPFLREFLRMGDTFHLIPFSDRSVIDIARRIEGRGDVETIIGRILLQYPLEPWSDIPGALGFAEEYAGTLPPSRPKRIVLVSDGDVSPAPGGTSHSMDAAAFEGFVSDARARLSRKGIDLAYVKAPVTAAPSSGRPSPPPPVVRPPESAKPVPAEKPSAPPAEGPPESRPPAAVPETAPPPVETGPLTDTSVSEGPVVTAPESAVAPESAAVTPESAVAPEDAEDAAVPAAPEPPRREIPAVESRESPGEFAGSLPLPLIIGLAVLALLVLGLVIFLAARRLQGTPNRAMARAAAPPAGAEPPQPRQPQGHNTDLLNNYAASRKPRTGPYENRYRPQDMDYGGPLLLNLFVEDQNTSIGKRNIHSVKSGYNFTVGGGRSEFLIFLVPIPPHIGEIRCEGRNCTFIPRKPQYFPDIGSQPVPECIGKTIRVISDKHYEIRFRLERYEDPLKALNRLLHSVQVPG
jgi:hypothetical protein